MFRRLLILIVVSWIPVESKPIETQQDEINYFQKFGYLEGGTSSAVQAVVDHKTFENTVRKFQRFAGLNQTGKVDEETKKMMNMPRCGNKDVFDEEDNANKRKKRYLTEGSIWPRKDLTYRISDYTYDLHKNDVDYEVERALKVWSDVSQLTFRRVSEYHRADIDIRFARRSHGDGNPFDGKGNILAHAFFPRFGGDCHMDEDEDWTMNSYSGTNLFQVVAHEIGHSLGLKHSDDPNALMAPFYRGYQRNFRLAADDISGITRLYGEVRPGPKPQPPTRRPDPPTRRPDPPTHRPPTRRPEPPTDGDHDYCRDARLDSMTSFEDGYAYAFRGGRYYKIDLDSGVVGRARTIASRLRGVPDNLDASLYLKAVHGTRLQLCDPNVPGRYCRVQTVVSESKLYLFKGSQHWVIRDNELHGPYWISDTFPGLPSYLDAAFVWGKNGKIYFTKGNNYYRVKLDTGVERGYPKSLSVWGLQSPIDAAFWAPNGYTYFFRGQEYYRFEDSTFRLKSGYPRRIAKWWFRCTTSNLEAEEPEVDDDQPFVQATMMPREEEEINNDTDKDDDDVMVPQPDGVYPGGHDLDLTGDDDSSDRWDGETSGVQTISVHTLLFVTMTTVFNVWLLFF